MVNELNSQAAQWFARMRAADVSDSDRQQHAEWLEQDPSHREAYLAVESEWQDLDELAPWAGEELGRLDEKLRSERDYRAGKKRWWSVVCFSGFASAAVTVLVILGVIPLVFFSQGYETMEGEQRKVVLQDGSRMHLNSASSVKVQFDDEVREVILRRGEVLFDVAAERARPFIVRASDSKVIAVGTSFSVYYKDGDIDVTVVEGQVAVLPAQVLSKELARQTAQSSAAEETREVTLEKLAETGILLSPDDQVTVKAHGGVQALKKVDATKLTAWNRGMLVLDGMPLRQVAEEMSRYIPGDVRVAADVPDYPVTGVIKIRDQESMLKLLSQVVPVTPVKQSAQVTLLYALAQNPGGQGNQ